MHPFSKEAEAAFARFDTYSYPQGWLRTCIGVTAAFLFGSPKQRFRLRLQELLSTEEERREEAVSSALFGEAYHSCGLCTEVTFFAITAPTIVLSAHLLLAPEVYALKCFEVPMAFHLVEFLHFCADTVDKPNLKPFRYRECRAALRETAPAIQLVGQICQDADFQALWKPLSEIVTRFASENSRAGGT